MPAVDVHVPGREKNSQVEQPGLYLTSGVVGYLAGFFMNRNHAARPTAENGKEVDDWPLETGSHSLHVSLIPSVRAPNCASVIALQ